MAQHDYVIANQGFPDFRSDLNSALSAIVSQNSGSSAPSTTYANQIWYDSSNNILYMRNEDNDAWITLFTLDQTADTAVAAADADTLKADVTDELTVGFTSANSDAGTKSSGTFTPDPRISNFQHAINGGAHTLAPPAYNSTMVILYKNNASAGAVTTSGFTKVDGDTLTTTNGDEFFMYITRYNDGSTTFSALTVKALQ